MTPEEQRVAIAEACGWIYPGSSCLKLESWSRWIPPKGCGGTRVPDYLHDLNAMRSAVFSVLEGPEKSDTRHLYRQELAGICGTKNDAIDASAEERAEAFLKTIGKWAAHPLTPSVRN